MRHRSHDLTLDLQTRLRPNAEGLIDYDASDHVAIAACNLLRRPVPRSAAGRERIGEIVHWGYGSAVALNYEALRRVTGSDVRATVLFFLGCQTRALVLFPTLGETPPPWRWRPELVLSSLTVHAIYAVAAARVSRAVR